MDTVVYRLLQFDLVYPDFERGEVSDSISENSLFTSIASLETLATGRCYRPSTKGAIQSASTGPPFAVGDEVLCNPETICVLRVWVLEAEHPRYVLRLEDGSTVDTGNNKCSLFPTYPPGKFDPEPKTPSLTCLFHM